MPALQSCVWGGKWVVPRSLLCQKRFWVWSPQDAAGSGLLGFDLTNDYSKGSPASGSLPERCERLALPSDLPSELVLAGLAGWLLTFVTAARVHAGLEVLGVWAGDTEVQLRLQHALPHPLAFVTSGGAAG